MWLYIPSTTSNSAPGPECSEPPSNSPSKPSEFRPCLYVTLSGKQSPRPLSWRGWKSRGWVSRLSGTTLEPSTAARGVASWIASVADTRALLSPVRVSDLAQRMKDTFGPASVKSLRKSSRHSVFSRMSQDTLIPDLIESSKTWKDWITGLRQDCLHRRKSARPCEMNGYTSSLDETWPQPVTITGGPNKAIEREREWKADLQEVSQNWPRPRASKTTSENPNQWMKRNASRDVATPPLAMAAENWPRPQARDEKNPDPAYSKNYQRKVKAGYTIDLNSVAANWSRPQARDWKSGDASPETLEKNSRPLNEAAANWLRPIASIYKDGRTSAKFKSKSPNSQTLNEQAVTFQNTGTTHHPETITELGELLQTWTPPECPRLNARFAEWLMGWPRDLTSFGLSETGWTRWRRHTLSCICSLISRKDEIYAHSCD